MGLKKTGVKTVDEKREGIQGLWGKRRKWLAAVSVILLVVSAVLAVQGKKELPVEALLRPEAGSDERQVELEVRVGGGGQGWSWRGTVAARVYTAAELEENFARAEEYVRLHLAREGESVDAVVSGVNLTEKVPGTGIRVEWSWEEDELLNREGMVCSENLAEATQIILTARLSCQDVTEHIQIPIRLVPPQFTSEEQFRHSLEEELGRLAESRQEDEWVALPAKWQGNTVQFLRPEGSRVWILPLAVLALLLLREVHLREEKKQEQKRQQEELERLYPDFVSRFVLLLGAGMNLYGVWQKLAGEYALRLEKGGKPEILYEQVAGTVREIRNGGLERKAYEEFGRKLRLAPYIRFSAILVQNLKMGSGEILSRLEYESREAMEERKASAKRQGEEMGTKLLLPMMVQLVLILALVMIPAFMSM